MLERSGLPTMTISRTSTDLFLGAICDVDTLTDNFNRCKYTNRRLPSLPCLRLSVLHIQSTSARTSTFLCISLFPFHDNQGIASPVCNCKLIYCTKCFGDAYWCKVQNICSHELSNVGVTIPMTSLFEKWQKMSRKSIEGEVLKKLL